MPYVLRMEGNSFPETFEKLNVKKVIKNQIIIKSQEELIMKLEFKEEDRVPFFNMVSVYKVFAELSEKHKKIYEPPISAIDLIIDVLGDVTILAGLYDSDYSGDDKDCLVPFVKFCLGSGKYTLDKETVEKYFGSYELSRFSIDIDGIWNHLVREGLEI